MDREIMLDKLNNIGLAATKEVIRLGGCAGVDRDELIFNFASSLMIMTNKYSFAKFKFK